MRFARRSNIGQPLPWSFLFSRVRQSCARQQTTSSIRLSPTLVSHLATAQTRLAAEERRDNQAAYSPIV